MARINLKEEETEKRTKLEAKEKVIKNGRNNQLQILSRGQDLIHPLSTLFIGRNGRKQQKYNMKFS